MRRPIVRSIAGWLLLASAACSTSQQDAVANRPQGEGYAGTGELVVRIELLQDRGGPWEGLFKPRQERAYTEIHYLGLDASGRAVFERHDLDLLAGAAQAVPAHATIAGAEHQGSAPALPPGSVPRNTRDIVLDLRLNREIRVQGKIVEVMEATPSGVVFRLY